MTPTVNGLLQSEFTPLFPVIPGLWLHRILLSPHHWASAPSSSRMKSSFISTSTCVR